MGPGDFHPISLTPVPACRLPIEQLYLQSQPVYQGQNNFTRVTLAHPLHEASLRSVLLLGNVGLKFAGTVTVSLPAPAP